MWPKLAAFSALLFIQDTTGEDCTFTVSVLDVPGVQCVSATPCSGTYYASGLSQGVGACPTGSSCALLPLTPIMGCAASGRTDLVYVNSDGTLTKDGKSVTLLGAPLSTLDPTTVSASSTSSITNSVTDSTTMNSATDSTTMNSATDSTTVNSATDSTTMNSATDNSVANSELQSSTKSNSTGSNASSGSGDTNNSYDEADVSNLTLASSSSIPTNLDITTSNSLSSESGSNAYAISPGSSSANQQAEFRPGSILSDDPKSSKSSKSDGLGLGSIIAIVVGCLAVVAIAAGARLLKKGKEGELATPEAAGGHEAYNNVGGGGGGGMTPKENVLLL